MEKRKRTKRSHKASTKIDHHVPKDIIHEILLRLPIKSIIRFQLVSKQWYSLIFNPVFIKSHLQFTKSQPLTLLIEYNDLFLIKCNANSAECTKDNGLPPLHNVLPKTQLCEKNYVIGSCEGLLCIYSYKSPSDFICLCNPATRACRQITPPELCTKANASGFGFVPSISDCKIVMLIRERYRRSPFRPNQWTWEAYVYSMKDDEWTEVDAPSIDELRFVDYPRHSVSVAVLFNEALHWVVSGRGSDDLLLKFDLVEEEFEMLEFVKLSDHDDGTQAHYYQESRYIGTMEPNNLCYCQQTIISDTGAMFVDLWILEQYGEWDSWKKLFTFESKAQINKVLNPYVLGVTSCGKVLINTNEGLAFVNASTDQLIYVSHENKECSSYVNRTYVSKYIPSLASPADY